MLKQIIVFNLDLMTIPGSDVTTSIPDLPIISTGHRSSTTTNSDISVTMSSNLTKSTTDNNIMPQTTDINITVTTQNGTNSMTTLPPMVTVQISTIIVAVLVATAVILLVVVTIIVTFLTYKCKKFKKKKHTVNVVADNNCKSLHQGQRYEGVYFNACNFINESEKETNPDQRCHLNHDTETGDQKHDLSEANFTNEVRYEHVESNRSQHFVIPLTHKQEESEAHYEQVPSEKISNKKELKSDSSVPLDHQYAAPTGGMGTSTTTIQQQQQGRKTRYDEIATYQKAAVYEQAIMYQKVATYERAVIYEKVPPVTAMIDH